MTAASRYKPQEQRAALVAVALTVGAVTATLGGCGDQDGAGNGASANAGEASARGPSANGMASADTIRARIIGNTVTGTMDPDSAYAEYYAPDGTIHGAGYQAEWHMDGDRMCFDYDEAPQADCYAVRLDGNAVEWRHDGETQGRGTIVAGNPNNF